MFGYVKAAKCKLEKSDDEIYSAAYCGLCKALGRNYGQISRLTLSFDVSFLALLLLALNDEEIEIIYKRCGINLKKKPFLSYKGETYKYVTAVSMILNYYKLIDNIDDKRGFKKLGYILLKPYFSLKRNSVKKSYPKLDDVANTMYQNQKKAESLKDADIDLSAEPTARALSQIFSLYSDENKQELSQIGYSIGKWIYLIDALDDYETDKKTGNFNPLLTDPDIKIYSNIEEIRKETEPILCNCISVIYENYKKLNIKRFNNVLENIIRFGLDMSKASIFTKKKGKQK
jgi:hypothetical protein